MGLKPSRTLLMLQNQCYFSEILFAVSLFLELTKSAYARVTDDKISEDMDKLMEKRKSSSQTDKKQTSI